MRVFVTGGTGFVGPAIVRALLDQEHDVTVLVHRAAGRLNTAHPRLNTVKGDIFDASGLRQAVAAARADALVHLVAIRRSWPREGITFEKFHVEATRNALAAADAAGARRFLHMSAHGVREDGTDYQRTKWQAEQLVRASALEWTIFRPTFVTGPKEGAAEGFDQEFAAMPALPNFGGGKFRLQPVAKRDVALAFARALDRPQTVRQTYLLAGDDVLTWEQYLRELGAALGKPKPLAPIPARLALDAAGLLGGFHWFPASRDELTMLMEDHVGDNGPATRDFDLSWTPFRTALREALGRPAHATVGAA